MKQSTEPDYEKLRLILERQLGKTVSLEYATSAGNFLINTYEILLYDNEVTDENDGKLTTGELNEP